MLYYVVLYYVVLYYVVLYYVIVLCCLVFCCILFIELIISSLDSFGIYWEQRVVKLRLTCMIYSYARMIYSEDILIVFRYQTIFISN